tara:strand:- start:992 stop:1450 length:459 start_codon:yes stop_codon:yes gene_type:complete
MRKTKGKGKGKYRKKAGNSGNSSTKKKKALEKITKETIKLKRKQEPCPICLENIEKKDRVETTCGHFFHKKCLQVWCIQKVKENKVCFCPVCKTDIILQTREAKNKIAEQKKNKNSNLGEILEIIEPHNNRDFYHVIDTYPEETEYTNSRRN